MSMAPSPFRGVLDGSGDTARGRFVELLLPAD